MFVYVWYIALLINSVGIFDGEFDGLKVGLFVNCIANTSAGQSLKHWKLFALLAVTTSDVHTFLPGTQSNKQSPSPQFNDIDLQESSDLHVTVKSE